MRSALILVYSSSRVFTPRSVVLSICDRSFLILSWSSFSSFSPSMSAPPPHLGRQGTALDARGSNVGPSREGGERLRGCLLDPGGEPLVDPADLGGRGLGGHDHVLVARGHRALLEDQHVDLAPVRLDGELPEVVHERHAFAPTALLCPRRQIAGGLGGGRLAVAEGARDFVALHRERRTHVIHVGLCDVPLRERLQPVTERLQRRDRSRRRRAQVHDSFSTRTAAVLNSGCFETGSQAVIVSSLAARGDPSGPLTPSSQ